MARETAFVTAARAVGLEPVTIRQGRATSYDSGVNAGRRLLTRPERPDAVFAVNDLMACDVMDVARLEFGLSVPGELSIIGFGIVTLPSRNARCYGLRHEQERLSWSPFSTCHNPADGLDVCPLHAQPS